MELSFSSERDDYDDDPTSPSVHNQSKPATHAVTHQQKRNDEQEEKKSSVQLTVQKPKQSDWASTGSSVAPSKSSFFMPSDDNSAETFKGKSATDKKQSAPASKDEQVEDIQAFNPADMEESISRKRSSSKRSRAERKRANAEAAAARGAALESAAPGAIGDESDRSHRSAANPSNNPSGKSSFQVDESGVIVGSAANKSMLAGMARKDGKGAFAPDKQLDFSSDEEEEGAANVRSKRQKTEQKSEAASSSSDRPAAAGGDVAPLINDVALDFVLRRWCGTLLGGMQFVWSHRSSDPRMPGVPLSLCLAQVILLLYPAAVGIVLNAINNSGAISSSGISCLIAGVICFLLHLVIHSIHRSLVSTQIAQMPMPINTNTKVVDSSAGAGPTSSQHGTSSSIPGHSNNDNYEQDLQVQVKRIAIQRGTLPVKHVHDEKRKANAKRKAEEEEDDASLPPGVARRAVRHEDDSDDDGAIDEEEEQRVKNGPKLSISLFSPQVARFILGPHPRSWVRIIFHAIVSGGLVAGTCYLLEWKYMHAFFDHAQEYDLNTSHDETPQAAASIYMAFSWMAFTLCLYGCNIRAPTELAKYSSDGWIEEHVNGPLSRSFYVALILLFHLAVRVMSEQDPFSLHPVVFDVHRVVICFFPALPALFAVGVLPPLDALFAYSFEQINIVLLGGTMQTNSTRAYFKLLTQSTAAVGVFLVWLFGTQSGAMLFAIGASLLLAWNLLPIAVGQSTIISETGVPDPSLPFPSFQSSRIDPTFLFAQPANFFKLAVSVSICGIGIAIAVVGDTNANLIYALGSNLGTTTLKPLFYTICLIIGIVLWILSEVYQPYVFFHLIRNPLYKRMMQGMVKPTAPVKPVQPPPGLLVASEKSKPLDEWNPFRDAQRKHQFFQWIVRIYMVLFVAYHQNFEIQQSTPTTHNARFTLFVYSALCLRSFSVIWHQSFRCILHMLCWIICDLVATDSSATSTWNSLHWNVQFLIVGFVWDRFRYHLVPKCWYMVAHSYTSFTIPKLAMRNESRMKLIWWILLPYHVGLVLVASFLGCNVLPFLGSPIFLLAFPRPQRVWQQFGGKFGMNETGNNEAANGGKDTVFYRQMFPGVYKALQQQLIAGPLSYTVDAGDFFLLRSEPYLIWLTVLESGLGYVVLQMKGFELQTTSCHTVEALHMDQHIDSILDNSAAALPAKNPLNSLYSYRPLMTLRGIHSFNITKNLLSGIIDDFDNLKLLSKTFLKCMIWQLHQHIHERNSNKHSKLSTLASFPSCWLKPTVSAYDIKQLEEADVWPTAYFNSLFAHAPLSQADASLFKKIVLSCYAIVETLANDVVGNGGKRSPNHVFQIFNGKIGASLYSDFLLDVKQADVMQLHALVLSSYRLAVKSVYDCAALASLETLDPPDIDAAREFDPDSEDPFADFHELMREYADEWYIGVAINNPTWDSCVARGDKKLFSIARGEGSAFTSLTLEKAAMTMHVCKLSSTAILSIWCSLNLELFYFANDDDERYSIQAHSQLLRNLSVQASEPPLGYPVYSDLPTVLARN